MTRKVLSTAVALALAIVALPAAQSGPPGDGEIRNVRDPSTRENLTTLTLMLSGPKGALPVNLVFTAVRGATSSAVSAVRIDVNMPLFVGEIDTKTPHVQFVMDRGAQSVTASVDASTVLPGRKFIQVPFDVERLKTLASASSATGRAFGIDFVLTAKQMTAIKQFARQLR